MRLSLWPPFPRVNSRRWRSQTFLTLYTRSWWDPLRTKKPSEKLLPKHDFFEHGARVKNCPTFCNLIFNVYSNSVSIKCISYISCMQWLKKCHSFSKSPLKKTAKNTWTCQHHTDNLWVATFPTPLVVWALGSRISCHVRRAPSSPTGALWKIVTVVTYRKQISGWTYRTQWFPFQRKKMVQRISDKFEF